MQRALFALLLPLALAACQRQAPAAPEPATTAASAAAPVVEAAVETTLAQAGVQPGPGAIDVKAFAGKFGGALPCADCPGIDETLELGADGAFTLTDVYRERPDATVVVQGSWSTEADGKRIRLDPGSKTEADRLYAIVDNDTLAPLDADGQAIVGAPDLRLTRGK